MFWIVSKNGKLVSEPLPEVYHSLMGDGPMTSIHDIRNGLQLVVWNLSPRPAQKQKPIDDAG